MTSVSASDHAAFALRVSTGVLFLAHGWMKVSIFTIPGVGGRSMMGFSIATQRRDG